MPTGRTLDDIMTCSPLKPPTKMLFRHKIAQNCQGKTMEKKI